MLQHLVVSHHGDPENGALRRPMTPEAVALSVLDLLDARLAQVFSVLAQTPNDQAFSPYVPSLERQLFCGTAAGRRNQHMSACEIARTMSLFEIDEALDLLIESAAEQAEGDISDNLRTALSEYVGAFGEKVDGIANYIKAQESFAEAAKKEACRLESRRKTAENRIKACKGFLCWFMTARSLKRLKGRLNTFTLASNSVDSLVFDDCVSVHPSFHGVSLTLSWPEWRELLSIVPAGTLHSRLLQCECDGKSIDRVRIIEALKAGHTVPGARLARGQHVRLA
jgi:hypothetical protein